MCLRLVASLAVLAVAQQEPESYVRPSSMNLDAYKKAKDEAAMLRLLLANPNAGDAAYYSKVVDIAAEQPFTPAQRAAAALAEAKAHVAVAGSEMKRNTTSLAYGQGTEVRCSAACGAGVRCSACGAVRGAVRGAACGAAKTPRPPYDDASPEASKRRTTAVLRSIAAL